MVKMPIVRRDHHRHPNKHHDNHNKNINNNNKNDNDNNPPPLCESARGSLPVHQEEAGCTNVRVSECVCKGEGGARGHEWVRVRER